MGCGGSKEEVASGNTVAKTDNSTSVVAGKTSTAEPSKAATQSKEADAKDIVAVANAERKLIGRDSSEQYLSMGKDEVALEAEVGSGGYRTPLAEEHGTPRHGVENDQDHVVEVAAAAAVVEKKAEEVKEEAGGAMGGAAGAVDGENGAAPPSSKHQVDGNGDESRKSPTDVKEATLAKEETKVVEKKNLGEGKSAGALP